MLPSEATIPTGAAGVLPFLSPNNLNSSPERPTISRARGGFNIGDGSLGLNYQDWTIHLWSIGIWANKGRQVLLGSGFLLLEVPNPQTILTLSAAFDRNMNPNLAWTTAEGAYFRWFDTEQQDYTVTYFPGVSRILLTHDDVRDLARTYSDVIVTWLEGGRIYYAIQRERYTIQREVTTPSPGRVVDLHNFGMTGGYRLQWEYTYGTN